ncbi:MAG: cell division protein FtsL [Nitrospinae bacterium]|nr:cell division protein FtsL [Nitrospinota bacterium]
MKRSNSRRGWREWLSARFSGKAPADSGVSLLKAGLCITFIACSAAALVWPHLEMVKIGYRLAHLESHRDKLLQDRRVLRIEVAALRQLDRIESIARKKMEMVFPEPGQIVYVKVGPGSIE